MTRRSGVSGQDDRALVEVMVRAGESLATIGDYLRCLDIPEDERRALNRFAREVADAAAERAPRHVILALGNALAFSVDGGRRAPADAREELADRLDGKLDPNVIATARLLLTELVSNCVRHGAADRPGTWIDTRVSLFPQALRVEVSDGGPRFRHEPQPPPDDDPTGRGLLLVDRLATRWGISERGRTRVWFELRRSA